LFEVRDDVNLPSYQSENINDKTFDEKSHVLDPYKMLYEYAQSTVTLNLLYAFSTGGYANIQRVTQWKHDVTEHSK
jgi:3-deoxy-7-phosphoheptulonate synthase